jgi:Pyruvate/2-oxoacid:ferredoxin oxidoreductase delta subunit
VEDENEPLGSRMEIDSKKCNGCGICVPLCCGTCIEMR